MSANFQIEEATWRDLNDLRRVERRCFGDDAWPLWDLVGVLTFPNVVRLKATVDGQMVGFVAGDSRPVEELGWITTIGVLPEYRQRGIATALLTECEALLNLPRIRLCVRKSNLSAIRLYEKRGYYQADVWPAYYSGGEDALVLEKKITPSNPGE